MRARILLLTFILFTSFNSLANSINLQCQHIYLEIDKSKNLVHQTTSAGTKSAKLYSDDYFYKYKMNDEPKYSNEYTLDRRTLVLTHFSKYFVGDGNDGWFRWNCNIIKNKTLI